MTLLVTEILTNFINRRYPLNDDDGAGELKRINANALSRLRRKRPAGDVLRVIGLVMMASSTAEQTDVRRSRSRRCNEAYCTSPGSQTSQHDILTASGDRPSRAVPQPFPPHQYASQAHGTREQFFSRGVELPSPPLPPASLSSLSLKSSYRVWERRFNKLRFRFALCALRFSLCAFHFALLSASPKRTFALFLF